MPSGPFPEGSRASTGSSTSRPPAPTLARASGPAGRLRRRSPTTRRPWPPRCCGRRPRGLRTSWRAVPRSWTRPSTYASPTPGPAPRRRRPVRPSGRCLALPRGTTSRVRRCWPWSGVGGRSAAWSARRRLASSSADSPTRSIPVTPASCPGSSSCPASAARPFLTRCSRWPASRSPRTRTCPVGEPARLTQPAPEAGGAMRCMRASSPRRPCRTPTTPPTTTAWPRSSAPP